MKRDYIIIGNPENRRVEFFQKDRAFSIEKAKRLLGYKPCTGLKEGLSKTAAWYKEQGLIK